MSAPSADERVRQSWKYARGYCFVQELRTTSDAELRRLMGVLRIDENVTAEGLKLAWRERMRENHPDKGGSDKDAQVASCLSAVWTTTSIPGDFEGLPLN